MLITVLTKRLRDAGGPWGDRAFAALSIEDAIRRFKGESPMLVIAPRGEARATKLAEQIGEFVRDVLIEREIDIAALIRRGDDDALTGQAAADTAEAIRDALMIAFVGFHPAPCMSQPEYVGMQIAAADAQTPVSAVVYRFRLLEQVDYDKLLEMGYNCDDATPSEFTVNMRGMTARVVPGSREPQCGD